MLRFRFRDGTAWDYIEKIPSILPRNDFPDIAIVFIDDFMLVAILPRSMIGIAFYGSTVFGWSIASSKAVMFTNFMFVFARISNIQTVFRCFSLVEKHFQRRFCVVAFAFLSSCSSSSNRKCEKGYGLLIG